jgi:hypothetical protein
MTDCPDTAVVRMPFRLKGLKAFCVVYYQGVQVALF